MMRAEPTIARPMIKTTIGPTMLQRSCTRFSSCSSNTHRGKAEGHAESESCE